MFRYVDDVRNFARPFLKGVRWNGCHFIVDKDAIIEDEKSEETDQERTVKEMVKAMSSLVSFLTFEGESSEMFQNGRLPTLDTEIWVDQSTGKISYSFYEKPMCPNR